MSLLPPIRILEVDDYEDWRNRVRSLLQTRPGWQVICEASDGREAVQKAEELQPDLVVLDVGLPRLNGIEAARGIRQVSPNSKIVFLSQDNSLEVVQAAMGTGAQGYVYKAHAQSELLPAIDAVLRGEQFVSSSVKGYKVNDVPGTKVPQRHEVQFYSDDAVFVESFARFIADALKAGNAAIVLATKSHLNSLLQKLRTEEVDIDGAIQRGAYISVDADDSLSSILVDDLPESARFFEGADGLIKAACNAAKAEYPRVACCGERVGLLWADGKTDAAIRLEQLCNDLCQSHEIDMLCAYPLNASRGEEDEQAFRSICAAHSAVYSQ
jgi:DNA-binding NarL/FixJ family response regulator